jgi:hypothetical protein
VGDPMQSSILTEKTKRGDQPYLSSLDLSLNIGLFLNASYWKLCEGMNQFFIDFLDSEMISHGRLTVGKFETI